MSNSYQLYKVHKKTRFFVTYQHICCLGMKCSISGLHYLGTRTIKIWNTFPALRPLTILLLECSFIQKKIFMNGMSESQGFHIPGRVRVLFSWKTTSHKDHLEVFLPNSRLLSGLIGMWSPMKITLLVFCMSISY